MLLLAALPPTREAEPLEWRSQSETGNETRIFVGWIEGRNPTYAGFGFWL
ncbi:MAG: hypothetical protein V7K36_31380 [Nostoc sp.]